MIFIRAGLDGGADDGTSRAAELRAEIVCLDFELFDSVHGWRVGDAVAADAAVEEACVVVDAIEQDVVEGKPSASGHERHVGPHARYRRCVAGQQSEREGVPSVERQVENFAILNHLAER